VKLATLTTSIEQLKELTPLLRDIYFGSKLEVLCLVTTSQEADFKAVPACHRRLREYAEPPLEAGQKLKEKSLIQAARRAVLEERPDLILWPTESFLKGALHRLLRELGVGEYELGQMPESELSRILGNFRTIDLSVEPLTHRTVKAADFLEPHWEKLGSVLESPCLLDTTPQLERECRRRFPHIEFHTEPGGGNFPTGLSLLSSTFSEHPGAEIDRLRDRCGNVVSLEPVNSPLGGARYNFSYRDYDNEFALHPPEMDLWKQFPPDHEAQVWEPRNGSSGPHPPPHPDGNYPAFFCRWPSSGEEWHERFELPEGESLRVVFADSGNVAGSVLHHTEAVNRFTGSEAWAVARSPHPFIGPKQPTERVFFVEQGPSQELTEVLRKADCIVFFEDDDENSPSWGFPFHEHVSQAAKLHLYIGYRVHQKTPHLTRPGRTILTPLPHILKMYPGSRFYAGFPPPGPLEEAVEAPRSESDGICRFLHTPSMPHWTTSRYPYHKDTEAFLEAARSLKAKHGSKVQFHQIAGWTHSEVLKARRECDVTFNQLRGFHGLSGDEAMMLGRPCVQAFDQININRHREYWGLQVDFPWVTTRREELPEVLEELLLDRRRREKIGEQSRQFMRKYFSPEKGILPLLYHCYRAVRGRPEFLQDGRGPT